MEQHAQISKSEEQRKTRRLGFPVKVMTRDDLKSNDSRRAINNPHLKVSLEYVDHILDHLDRHDIRMYRLSSDIAPYATHPDMSQFHDMVLKAMPNCAQSGKRPGGSTYASHFTRRNSSY